MREKTDYRSTLEQLNNAFDHELLTINEIADFLGLNRHTVSRIYDKDFIKIGKSKRMNKTTLARLIT